MNVKYVYNFQLKLCYVYIYIYLFTYIHVHTYTCTYMYVCMYIYIYLHIYISLQVHFVSMSSVPGSRVVTLFARNRQSHEMWPTVSHLSHPNIKRQSGER